MPKYLLPFLIFALSCESDSRREVNIRDEDKEQRTAGNELEEEERTLVLTYAGFACPCAQWITVENNVLIDSFRENDLPVRDLFYHLIPAYDSYQLFIEIR